MGRQLRHKLVHFAGLRVVHRSICQVKSLILMSLRLEICTSNSLVGWVERRKAPLIYREFCPLVGFFFARPTLQLPVAASQASSPKGRGDKFAVILRHFAPLT